MALSADRNTAMKDGELIGVPVAAGAVIYAGSIVVANADGYAEKGTAAAGLSYLGRAEERVHNTGGADGSKTVLVRRGKAFLWKNSATDQVTQASLGKPCYIEDDETVSMSDNGGTRSPAGTVIGVDSDGVWVAPETAHDAPTISAAAELDFGSIDATDNATKTITVTGAEIGDAVALGLPAEPPEGILFQGFVSAADTVTIRAENHTASAIDPEAATFRVTVLKA